MTEIKDKVLAKAKDGIAPQYYNDTTQQFEVVTGVAGKLATHDSGVINAVKSIAGAVVIDSFSAEGETTKRYPRGASVVTVVNDGNGIVNLTVDSIKVEIKEGEVFSETFNEFVNVFVKGEEYRVIVKGVK